MSKESNKEAIEECKQAILKAVGTFSEKTGLRVNSASMDSIRHINSQKESLITIGCTLEISE